MKPYRLPLFITLFLLILSIPGFPYSKDTHKKLNEKAVNISVLVTENYLNSQLGFSEGIEEKINGGKVWEWIRDGGAQEDESFRYKNHFHNPLEENWKKAGLSDVFSGTSSIIWAQDVNQEWSWKNARDYYHLALTSETKEERDQHFADMFRALGQVMHLIEDSSVPAHSRNDTHVLYNYEDWVAAQEPGLFNTFLANPLFFDEEILDRTPNSLAPIPIARIVDTDKYTGANPGVGTGNAIGLSEYANINFLSKDTMFTSDFPHPAKSDVELRTYNGKLYLRKKTNAGGALVEYLAVTRWKYWYRLEDFPDPLGRLPVGLDNKCYEDYARFLLPRAVGYSAGLLDYFFRGKFKVEMEYIPDTLPVQYKLTITNESGEEMDGGTLDLYYDSELAPGRIKVDGYSSDYSGSLEDGGAATGTFTMPDDYLWGEGYFVLVFRGKLGQEEEAVIGKAFSMHDLWLYDFGTLEKWGITSYMWLPPDELFDEWQPVDPPVWEFPYGPACQYDIESSPATLWSTSETYTATPIISRMFFKFNTTRLKEEDYGDKFYLSGYLKDGGGKYPTGIVEIYKTDISQGWDYVWNNDSQVVFSTTASADRKFYLIEIPKEIINFGGTTDFVFKLDDESGEPFSKPYPSYLRSVYLIDIDNDWWLIGIKTGSSE